MLCYLPAFSWMLGPMLWSGPVPRDMDLKLMKELTTDLGKNEAISPFVMSTLMTQLWLGANGTTRKEMTSALGIKGEHFYMAYHSAITDMNYVESTVNTTAFNGIYVREGKSVKPDYKALLDSCYSSRVANFSTAEDGAKSINSAVANVTNNLIPTLVTPGVLEDAMVVLVSALYFKGQWYEKFNRTEPGQFLTPSGEKTVAMMKMETSARYKKTSTYDAITLYYDDPDFCMVLVRPLERSMGAVERLRDSLDSLKIEDIAGHDSEVPVDVAMPRFKIETSYNSLEDVFPKLGIKKVFTPEADLGNMFKSKLYVGKIIHKVFIEVTESGTEAAGAGAIITYGGARPVSFTLDRPFFAVVWNRRHWINMFTAYVSSP